MSLLLLVCVVEILCVCLLNICRITGDSLIVRLLTRLCVIDGGEATVQLLDVEVTARSFLAQSFLKVLQLTQEVKIWGN